MLLGTSLQACNCTSLTRQEDVQDALTAGLFSANVGCLNGGIHAEGSSLFPLRFINCEGSWAASNHLSQACITAECRQDV